MPPLNRYLICQLLVILAPVLFYRKYLISARVGSANCEKVGRDNAGSIPGQDFIFYSEKRYKKGNFVIEPTINVNLKRN